jgi:hypothetical protein
MSTELEVRRGRRWARHAGNALLALSMLSLPGSCLLLCAAASPQVAASCLALLIVSVVLWWLGTWGSGLIEARRTRRLLRAELAALLAEEGLSALDPADPARVERERVFWRDTQQRALDALRARFVVEPARLDLLGAMRGQIAANASTFYMLGAGCLAAICGCALIGSMFYSASLTTGASFGVGISLSLLSAALLLLAKETVSARSASREERRAFEQESRRIVTMAELAGGLTLVDSMGDDALIGALSPEGARGGELERAEEGA